MTQLNLIVDVALCENCNTCILATKDEYVGNSFPGYSAGHARHGRSVIDITRHVRGSGHMVDVTYLPAMCNHCDNAPCIKAGNGAVKKRADGIVIIDPVEAKGRRDLVDACPYGAMTWNDDLSLPQTWIFDAHLLDQGWKEPRASHVCPTDAIAAAKLTDREMSALERKEGLRVLKPELGTKPRVIASGIMAHMIAPDSRHISEIDDMLTLDGLRILFDRNKTARPRSRARTTSSSGESLQGTSE